MKQNVLDKRRIKSQESDIRMSEEPGIRVWSDEIYNEGRTPNVRDSILVRDLSGELHICQGDISVCGKYDESYCGNKIGNEESRNGMDKPVPNSPNQYSTTSIHKCIVQLIVTKSECW